MCYYKSFKRASNYLLRKQQVMEKVSNQVMDHSYRLKLKTIQTYNYSGNILFHHSDQSCAYLCHTPSVPVMVVYIQTQLVLFFSLVKVQCRELEICQSWSLQFVSVFTERKSGYTHSSVDFSALPIHIIKITEVQLMAQRLFETCFFTAFRHKHFNSKYQG